MNDEDRKFEAFLREFEPRLPRALPAGEDAWFSWPRLAAAAALILVLAAASLWIGMRRFDARNEDHRRVSTNIPSAAANQQRPMSTLALTRAALENSPEFDKEMDSRARHDLPRFNRKESMLSVLAKE